VGQTWNKLPPAVKGKVEERLNALKWVQGCLQQPLLSGDQSQAEACCAAEQ
jgi:hypothetical protein